MKIKHSPPVSVLLSSLLGCLFGFGAAFGAEPPLRLISYTPDYIAAEDETEPEESASTLYSVATTTELRALAGELELLVFTTKAPGVCPACDRARDDWKRAAKEYPITPVYCSMSATPRTKGDRIAEKYGVEAFPTFVLVVRNEDGTADELDRWRGAGNFWESTEKRIKRAFAEADYQPRIEIERRPPKPRPIPGLNPPKPPIDEPKPPRRKEPKTGKPRPRFGFELSFE